MSSEVDICNRALSRVGSTKLIESLDQAGSAEAAQCQLWYVRLRDEVLSAYAWPFAMARASLAVVANESRTNWSYVYALPTDCLQAVYVTLEGVRKPQVAQRIPFAMESMRDTGGKAWRKVMLCDLENAELVYTARIEDPEQFDPLFEDALTWRLAAELAMALLKKTDIAQWCLAMYQHSLHAAAANSANESQEDPDPNSSFETSRL